LPAAAFTSGRTHHDLLLIEAGEVAAPSDRGRRLGLYYCGLDVGDSDQQLCQAYDRLVAAGVAIVGTSDHAVTHSAYILPPVGNETEHYINVPSIA
jgi:catechol 2,3-dioxygenase